MTSPKRPLVIAVALALLAACGLRPDEQPRTIPGPNQVADAAVGSGSAAGGAERIFLIAPGEPRLLRSVSRTATTTAGLIEVLLDGPNERELDAQWTTAIPAGTRLLDSSISGSILFLDLTPEITDLPASLQRQALAQIVYTAAESPGISGVQITIDGEPEQLSKGNGQATTSLLRPYDYPGYVQSAQPPYPALPSN